MGRNVANQLVDTLAQAGVKHIYAITGDSLNEINSAVRVNGEIEWIHVRHEETGAFAAGAEAQLTGGLSCCAGSSGPGHVHLVNGLYDCNRSYAPVVALATTCASSQFGTQYFQETNTESLFADCSIYNDLATTPTEAQRMLHQAMESSVEQGGVGVVALPGDISALPEVPLTSTLKPLVSAPSLSPDAEQVREAAEMLNASKKICLYCGSGIRNAHDEVMELAKVLSAPVVSTLKGKDCVLYDCPNGVGNGGGAGLESARRAVMECDVLVMIGNDFPYTNFLPKATSSVKVIQVDCRGDHLGRRIRVDLGICADSREFARALLPLLSEHPDQDFLNEMLKCYKASTQAVEKQVANQGTKDEISPLYLLSVIDRLADDDAIFTIDTGMNISWSARRLTPTGKRRFLGSFNHGSMANAMPQAMGAALACKGRQVIGLCGDGGISMLLGDLATIAQYKLPVKLFVFDNRMLGFVEMEMVMDKIPVWQTNMVNPDFGRVATDMGFLGITVHDPSEVEAAVAKALTYPGPALVSVMTKDSVN